MVAILCLNIAYLCLIVMNIYSFVRYFRKLVFSDMDKVIDEEDLEYNHKLYLDSIALFSFEFLALCFISVVIHSFLFLYQKLMISRPSQKITVSANMFLLLMPAFYVMRAPLFLGIINSLNMLFPPNHRSDRF